MGEPNYRREFRRSPHHVWLAILTLGLGLLSAEFLGLILGATAYTIGWIYLPDSPFFKKWFRKKSDREERKRAMEEMVAFVRRRDAHLAKLTATRRERYDELAVVCRDIEKATMESADGAGETRVRKLEELMWTYLRLLGMEESLEVFLESERREDLPGMVTEAEQEMARLTAEVDAAKTAGTATAADAKERLLSSRRDRLDVLRRRLERSREAKENLLLVTSEQDRLQQQIKLIRADSMAMRNAEALTARIDASVEQLDQTNKWLAQMAEFKDVVGDLPPPDLRIGFGEGVASHERQKRGKVKERG